MKFDIFDHNGNKAGSMQASDTVFAADFNEGLVHQALVRQLANGRRAIAKTKTRGEVSGGGKKPHKQKGTGRARSGSIRNPIWRGGGIIFGPTGTENYTVQMPQKQRKRAVCSVVSEKVRQSQVVILDTYPTTEIKTKQFVEMMSKLPVERSVLFVIPEGNEVIVKSVRNVTNAKVLLASYLNVADVLKYKYVVMLKDAVSKVEEIFSV